MTNPSGLIPQEFNCVVALDKIEEKTAGGIILPPSKQDMDKVTNQEGTLVAVAERAGAEIWGEIRPQVGDRVLFSRYAGAIHERGGREYRILKDKDIIAVVEPPALAAVA